MKTKIFTWLCLALLICSGCDGNALEPTDPKPDDPTIFTSSSIVGTWACIATNNLAFDVWTGEWTEDWDYDPNALTYDVKWYFDIKSDSQVRYVNIVDEEDMGEYRKSDKYLHIPANSEWRTLVDATYIFDQQAQAIRCTKGTVLGFNLESVKDLLGSDTIFYVKRYGIDEAALFDNTGWIQSQYVVRVKGIKEDL